MKIYDISMTISQDIPVYNNLESKKPKLVNVANFDQFSHYETDITMNLHTGTHIDAPLHMIPGGATMSLYTIEDFVTEAKVLDLTSVEGMITEADLSGKDIQKGDFLLFKTKNSFETSFNKSFISLEKSGAIYLAQLGIKGAGIDALGIERSQPQHETHKALLNAGIMILEGLVLKDVPEGTYQLIVLPLKLLITEAAPARAILIKN